MIRFTLVIILAAGLIASAVMSRPPGQQGEPPIPTVEQLQPLADLVVARVPVSDVVTARIAGHLGSLEAIVIARGEALVSVDLARARFEQVDIDDRTAELVLPQPRVLGARLDHRRTRVHTISAGGLWAVVPTDVGRAEVVDQAMSAAERSVAAVGNSGRVREEAQRHAEEVLCSFLADTLGWHIRVRWGD